MSLTALLWALDTFPADSPVERLVMVALADGADQQGRGAWPTRATIAARACCSVSTVRRILLKLEEEGWVRRGDQALALGRGDRKSVVWDLAMTDQPTTREPSAVVPGSGCEPLEGDAPRGFTVNPRGDGDGATGVHQVNPRDGHEGSTRVHLGEPRTRTTTRTPTAADAAADDDQDDDGALDGMPAVPVSEHKQPTTKQRAYGLARGYADALPLPELVNLDAVAGVVARALARVPADVVESALADLAADDRTVTLDSLRIAVSRRLAAADRPARHSIPESLR